MVSRSGSFANAIENRLKGVENSVRFIFFAKTDTEQTVGFRTSLIVSDWTVDIARVLL